MEGFIKLYRSIMDWEWYKDANTARVFLHILLEANAFSGRSYKGVPLPRGSFPTSPASIAEKLGLSTHQVRTALDHLKMTNEVSIKTTNKFTVITVENWAKYQGVETENAKQNVEQGGKQVANNCQTNDKQVATQKEREKERKEESSFYKPVRTEGMSLSELGDAICAKTGMKKLSMQEVHEICQAKVDAVNAKWFAEHPEDRPKNWRA